MIVVDRKTIFAVSGYMAISASLLVVNKLSVYYLPMPSLILFCQLLCASLFTFGAGKLGLLEVDALSMESIRKFWLVPAVFLLTIFSNIKVLQHSNVETFIVFRASAPLALSVLDALFLDRDLPNRRSLLCLLGIFVAGFAYMEFEKGQLNVDSIFWAVTWYVVFCINQIYIKHVVDNVKMTTWGRVLYTNLLPLGPLLVINVASGELSEMLSWEPTWQGVFWLLVSCVFGTLMSFFAFSVRELVSATAFSVVGDACKALTILINVMMWDKHATLPGILSLLACLTFAFFYEQSPVLKDDKRKAQVKETLRTIGFRVLPAATLFIFFMLSLSTSGSDSPMLGGYLARFRLGQSRDGMPVWFADLMQQEEQGEGTADAYTERNFTLERVQELVFNQNLDESTTGVGMAALLDSPNAKDDASFVLVTRKINIKRWFEERGDGDFTGSAIYSSWMSSNLIESGKEALLGNGMVFVPFFIGSKNHRKPFVLVQKPTEMPMKKEKIASYIMSLDGETKLKLTGFPGKRWAPVPVEDKLLFVMSLSPLRISAIDLTLTSGDLLGYYEEPEKPSVNQPKVVPSTRGLVLEGRFVFGVGYRVREVRTKYGVQEALLWRIDLENLDLGAKFFPFVLDDAPRAFLPTSVFYRDGQLFLSGVESNKVFHNLDHLQDLSSLTTFRNFLYRVAP